MSEPVVINKDYDGYKSVIKIKTNIMHPASSKFYFAILVGETKHGQRMGTGVSYVTRNNEIAIHENYGSEYTKTNYISKLKEYCYTDLEISLILTIFRLLKTCRHV
jgi:hypothetical protein